MYLKVYKEGFKNHRKKCFKNNTEIAPKIAHQNFSKITDCIKHIQNVSKIVQDAQKIIKNELKLYRMQ